MATTTATVRTTVTDEVPERSSWKYQATMNDENGNAIQQSDIDALTLTVYVLDDDKTIVNNCEGDDILDVGRGTVGTNNGALSIRFEPDDSEMIDTSKKRETHIALIEMTWNSGTKKMAHEVAWTVVNMGRRD